MEVVNSIKNGKIAGTEEDMEPAWHKQSSLVHSMKARFNHFHTLMCSVVEGKKVKFVLSDVYSQDTDTPGGSIRAYRKGVVVQDDVTPLPAPTHLQFTYIEDGAMTLTWRQPPTSGMDGVHYVLHWGESPDWERHATSVVSHTFHGFPGLLPDKVTLTGYVDVWRSDDVTVPVPVHCGNHS